MFYDSASLSSVLPMSSAMQYPDPLPNDFIVALLELCPKKTCTCFGCRKDLRTFKANKMICEDSRGLVIISKAFRPIKRDSNGALIYTKDLRNVYFHASQFCVRVQYPSFHLAQAEVFVLHVDQLSEKHQLFLVN